MTLRVFPKPEFSAVLTIRDVAPEGGFAALRRVWSSPLEATGLAYIPCGDSGNAFFRLEGAREPLKQKTDALRAMLGIGDFLEVHDTIFEAIGNGKALNEAASDLWRVTLPPAHSANFIAASGSKFWLADWAGGLLWIAGNAPLHAQAEQFGGSAILLRASVETRENTPVFTPLSVELAVLTRSVKAAFDPAGLFNPGRMYEGI
jgi:glycolate oxidase FAD binding subunit